MSEYQEPLKINSQISSTSSLEGTVIGILFDKTGAEIQKAIAARVTKIDVKIKKHQDNISELDTFVKDKQSILEEIEKTYRLKQVREAEIRRPFDRQIADLIKKRNDELFTHTSEAENVISGLMGYLKKGFEDKKVPEPEQGSNEKVTITTSGNVGIGCSNPTERLIIQGGSECPGLSYIKEQLWEYANSVTEVNSKILELQQEKRRLQLISDNISVERSYKLDLNKLSAFGFEDLE